jgi:hypothetical protein
MSMQVLDAWFLAGATNRGVHCVNRLPPAGVDAYTSPFKPEVYQNPYKVALLALIKKNQRARKRRA